MAYDETISLEPVAETETERDRLMRELTAAGKAYREGRGSLAEVHRLAGLVANG